MNPLKHRFSFFPLGTCNEIEVIPFLGIDSPLVVSLPPLSYAVLKKVFEGVTVILDGKRVILFVINDSIFNDIVTNQNVLNDIVSCTKDDFASIWFIGLENKLALLAEYFRDYCEKKEELYFHNFQRKDVTYHISKNYKKQNQYVYRLTPVSVEHFAGKN